MNVPEPLILTEDRIRQAVDPAAALAAVRQGFIALHEDRVTLPAILDFEFPEHHGEAHVKGAHIHGADHWVVKAAAGFFDNPEAGLPAGSGVSLVFSASTGFLDCVLLDNGYLTDLRTAAAGALSIDLLARQDAGHALIVGAGVQARLQLQALLGVRTPQDVTVFARRPQEAVRYAEEMTALLGVPVQVADDLETAAGRADLIVTTTPARAPLIAADWLRPGTHISAVGSDLPGKQELDAGVLGRADIVAADLPAVAAVNGELQHAVASGVVDLDRVVALGALAVGAATGRTTEDQITVADLVGLGVQDAAIAGAVVARLRG